MQVEVLVHSLQPSNVLWAIVAGVLAKCWRFLMPSLLIRCVEASFHGFLKHNVKGRDIIV